VGVLAADDLLLVRRFVDARGAERDTAFAELYRAHAPKVRGLCTLLLRGRGEVDDAIQETFIAVAGALHNFRGDARLSTWIFRIAVRTAIRVAGRTRAHEPLDEEPAAPDVHLETSRRLRAAMAELPAEQRAVLALFSIEGLRHGEIAEILGVPEGTVWSRLHAARKRLAALLDDLRGP
jgi:RNA polymerase sigma-70 factor (ECF subfamily)